MDNIELPNTQYTHIFFLFFDWLTKGIYSWKNKSSACFFACQKNATAHFTYFETVLKFLCQSKKKDTI